MPKRAEVCSLARIQETGMKGGNMRKRMNLLATLLPQRLSLEGRGSNERNQEQFHAPNHDRR